jgi:two-component system, OmpR family, aerobic respiration control sensor histidine kinase ArcB
VPLGLGPNLPDTEEELFRIDSHQLFDEGAAAIITTAGSKDILLEILTMLIKETIPQELDHLEKAHNELNWDAIQKISHKLMGTALYCGTTRMRYASQYMECYMLAGHSKALEELYKQLVQVLGETRQAVKNWLES